MFESEIASLLRNVLKTLLLLLVFSILWTPGQTEEKESELSDVNKRGVTVDVKVHVEVDCGCCHDGSHECRCICPNKTTTAPTTTRPTTVIPARCELIITGVAEVQYVGEDGSVIGRFPKAVELYATENIPDLSIYSLGIANDGGGSDGGEINLSGSLSAGSFYYVDGNSGDFGDFFGGSSDVQSAILDIDGNDAVELFKNGVLVDVYGDVNVNGAGQNWEYTKGWAYRRSFHCPFRAFSMSEWNRAVNVFINVHKNSEANPKWPKGTFSP